MVTAIYERASDEKQDIDGVSIETQHDTIMKFCDYKGYKNIKVYMEIKSARSMENRAKLKQLIIDVKRGIVKRIVIYKLDRLTRSLRDLMNLLHTLDKNGCELHSTYENIDTSSPSGRMLVQVLGMIAEWESANTSMRVTNSMQFKASQGIWMSSVPFGFYLGEDKRLKVKEDEASILREAFELIKEGYSTDEAERIIIKKYNVTWGNNYLRRKIRHATTVGNIERNGIVYENTHEAIISESEQNKLIEILENRMTGRRGIEHNDIFRRRISCQACNSIMVVNARSFNDYKTVHYSYVCDNCYENKRPFMSVSESVLEDAFINYMSRLKIENMHVLESSDDTSSKVSKLKRRLKTLSKQRERIQRAWITERMNDEELDKYQKEIDEEEMEIEEELSKLSVKRTTISSEELMELQEYFSTHFNKLTREEKRSFVQQHIKKIQYKRTLVKGYKKKYNTVITNVEFF